MGHSIVAEKSYLFSVRIVRLCRLLKKRGVESELRSQLFRSGTSVGANLSEALYGNSASDFLYKVRISLRECSETRMWLRLLHDTDGLSDNEYESILNDCVEILKMLTAISVTMQKNSDQKN